MFVGLTVVAVVVVVVLVVVVVVVVVVAVVVVAGVAGQQLHTQVFLQFLNRSLAVDGCQQFPKCCSQYWSL